MAQISNCLKLLSKIDERDQDALVARLDELQAQGVPAEKAQIQAAIDVLMRAQADAAGIQRSAARDTTETPEFKRWSGGAPLVRLGESHEYRSGQPVVVEALHGTTNSDLTEFKRERANIESDWGAGFYASNTPDDVAANYANNDGADLTQRIELLAERLASNEFDDDMDAAREEAKKRLTQESPNTLKLYVRMSNPAVQGGPGETFFDYTEEYDEEADSYGEPTGKLVDFVESLRNVAYEFNEFDADAAMADVWNDATDSNGISLTDLVAKLKASNAMLDAADDDGNIASSEAIRRALEDMGFDGVIDTTVYDKFGPKVRRSGQLYDRSGGMRGMDKDTVHFIAFEPTQLKSATGNRGTFNPEDADITRSAARQIDTPEFRRWFADSKVVDADGKPLVVYHGTGGDFSAFDPQAAPKSYRSDAGKQFFTDSPDVASEYAQDAGSGANVMPVYLSMKNPRVEETEGSPADWWDANGDDLFWRLDVEGSGHDGVIVRGPDSTMYVTSSPNKIKSAIGNSGNFDPADQNITRSIARPAFYSQLQRAIEQVPDRLATMAAPQWKLWLDANASKLGIKKDEIEWSGIKDYLTLRGKDKVSREDLVAYLGDSGVRVQEVVLGSTGLRDTGEMYVAEANDWGDEWAVFTEDGSIIGDTYKSQGAAEQAMGEMNADGEPTKYGTYTVPGGENYREVLITLPERKVAINTAGWTANLRRAKSPVTGLPEFEVLDADGDVVGVSYKASNERDAIEMVAARDGLTKEQRTQYKSSHWDATNVLAHIRVDDRVDADGNKVLFLQEIQSDWGQSMKKNGPGKAEYRVLNAQGTPIPEVFATMNDAEARVSGKEGWEIVERRIPGVPDGPFITDTKAWASLALKRAIMMAVEGGHDRVALINGRQAADLYDLSKQVEAIEWTRRKDGTYDISAFPSGGGEAINKDRLSLDAVSDFIGKELADRISKDPGEALPLDWAESTGLLKGIDLKVGGEGMRAFYDEIIPQVARDVLKKLGGGQLATTKITTDKNGWHITPPSQTASGKWMVKSSDYNSVGLKFDTEAEARAALAEKQEKSEQVSFDITDSMREKAASGVPLFSKGRTTGDYGRAYTTEQQEMFKNTGRTVAPQTLIERVKEARSDMWKKMAQGIVDQFRPIRDLGGDAYTLARLSKGSAGAFEALLNYGKLSIVDGAYDADMSGGFIKTIGEPLGAELEDFAWWVASNRAERLAIEDRENLFSRRDIDAGKSLAQGTLTKPYTKRDGTTTTDRAEAYADSLVKFNEFNKNVLDIAEQSGLIDGDARKIWENEFYVPFYRVSEEDGQFMGAKIKGGLARQRAFQELKGGSQKLNSDLLANTMKNWAHLIDASAKNRAAKATLEAAEMMNVAIEADAETVRQLGKSIGGKGGTVWFMDGGQQRHFVVGDPHLLAAINSLEYAGLRGPLMDALSATKHWLTVGVTTSPAFKVRNLIRDSLQAISVSDLSYNPIANMKDGIKASARDSQTYVSALASGGLIRFGTMMEGNGPERVRRLVQKGVNQSTILDSEAKIKAFYSKTIEPVVDAYNELGNRGEEINRAALYSQLRKQGKSHAQAALLSRDLMDFSMQGTWASIRFLTQVVPFLNARLQGLYKLGRGASEDPRKFAITTGAVAMVSIALMAAYSDDEDWKKREDWDRDTNWWFKIGGVAFRIPKPFEIGAIGTLAERGVELFTNDEFTLKRFLGRVKHIASDNLAMNPVPQAIKPIIDVYANKDAFSGRPIESMGMERLQSEYRYTANTSMVARGASTALNTISRNTIGEESLSPVQIDSMLRGYFGWLGTFIVGGADMLTRPLTNEPSRPQADYLKAVTQGIARQAPEPSSKYVSAVYDQAKILEQAYATHRQLIREGKVDDAREFAEDNADLLRRYRLVERVKGAQSQINRTIREIERSDMDPKKKREEIQKLRDRQSKIAAEVY